MEVCGRRDEVAANVVYVHHVFRERRSVMSPQGRGKANIGSHAVFLGILHPHHCSRTRIPWYFHSTTLGPTVCLLRCICDCVVLCLRLLSSPRLICHHCRYVVDHRLRNVFGIDKQSGAIRKSVPAGHRSVYHGAALIFMAAEQSCTIL